MIPNNFKSLNSVAGTYLISNVCWIYGCNLLCITFLNGFSHLRLVGSEDPALAPHAFHGGPQPGQWPMDLKTSCRGCSKTENEPMVLIVFFFIVLQGLWCCMHLLLCDRFLALPVSRNERKNYFSISWISQQINASDVRFRQDIRTSWYLTLLFNMLLNICFCLFLQVFALKSGSFVLRFRRTSNSAISLCIPSGVWKMGKIAVGETLVIAGMVMRLWSFFSGYVFF